MTKVFNKITLKSRRQVLRKRMPHAEIILWSRIRRKQIGDCRFRRQYSVGPYVLGFLQSGFKLAIEIDGESHFRSREDEYDRDREEWIKRFGIEFLRFQNTEVHKNLYGVLQTIYEKIQSMKKEENNRPPLVVPLAKGDVKNVSAFPLHKGKTQKGSEEAQL